MNRVIKFRAWDKKSGDFITDCDTGDFSIVEIDGSGFKVIQLILVDSIVNGEHDQREDCAWITENAELMQFTGLTDKNGADIYEGDILRVLHTDWPSKSNDDPRTIDEYMNALSEKYLVGFEEGAFTMFYDGDKDSGHYIKCGTHGFIEVIGNIYENPELLQ